MPKKKALTTRATTKPELVVKKTRRSKRELSTVTGMRDILPQDQKYWNRVRLVALKVAHDYNYERLDTPIIEQAELFTRSVGASTDIVAKETFSFVDQGGDNLMLRPEVTASVVRAYLQHGLVNQTQPVKTFYMGPLFRHEKPQSGRYRQFFQFGFESIGSSSPVLDAQMILMGWNVLNDLGIESVIQVNSIGCKECRDAYKKALVKHYRSKSKDLCENCKTRLTHNPLRLLDCKEDACQDIKDSAPQILDFLDDSCKDHFMTVVEYLDELNVPYVVNPFVVRGLDYYTKTIFEYWSSDDPQGKHSLGGGGRYDDLVTLLGGREETPACGFAMGIDRIISKIREKNIEVKDKRYDVFVAQLGEAARKKAMVMYETLRKNEVFTVSQAFYESSLKKQLELANKMKVKFTLILGQKEVTDGTIMLRDMEGGVQEVIDFSKIEAEIGKRLEKYEEGAVINLTEDEEKAEREKAEMEAIKNDSSQVDDIV